MKCPGCSYSGNQEGYSGMPTASYIANMGGCAPQASYSHMSQASSGAGYSAGDNLPAIAYDQSSNNVPSLSYSALPSQLDYHISKALLEIESRKQEMEQASASNEITVLPSPIAKYEVVPVQQGFVEIPPENQAMLAEMQKQGQFLPTDQGMPQNGAVRLTQTDIEEDLLIMRRTRIRQRSMTFVNGSQNKKEPKRIN